MGWLVFLLIVFYLFFMPLGLLCVVIAYAKRFRYLEERLDHLEWEAGRLKAPPGAAEPTRKPPGKAPQPAPVVIAAGPPSLPPSLPVTPPKLPAPVPPPIRPAVSSLPASPPPRLPAEATSDFGPQTSDSPPSRTRAEWEAIIGGKWLNRIGALALVIGIGFFLKYAFNHNIISQLVRVLIGVGIGAALLFLGARYDRKGFGIFAQGLVGAGISTLYLSVYASLNFYHIVPQSAAFVAMAAVTGITFAQAFKYNSFVIAFMGWLGGFLTPYLLSTGHPNEAGLFTYIALLDAGVLAIVARKERWIALEPLTLGATYLTYLLWYRNYYTPADMAVTAVFLSLFWALFVGLDAWRASKSQGTPGGIGHWVACLNTAFYYTALYAIINPQHPDWMGGITLAIGAVYLLTVLVIKRRRPVNEMAFARFVLTAILLLILATTLQFEGFLTVFYWSLEALFLVWCAKRWNLGYVKGVAYALFGLAFLKLFATSGVLVFSPVENFTLLFNPRALAFATLAAALGASAYLLKREDDTARTTLNYGWCMLLFTLLTVETNDYFLRLMFGAEEAVKVGLRFNRYLTLAVIWMACSLPLVWFGLKKRVRPALYSGLAVLVFSFFLAMIRGAAFAPVEQFSILANTRAVALGFILTGLLAHARWLKAHRMKAAHTAVLYGWCILFFTLCTAEANDLFRRLLIGAESRDGLEFKRNMTLAVLWVTYSLPMVWHGIRRKSIPALHCGLVVMAFAACFAGVFGLAFTPIENFHPALNYRACTLAFILAALLVHAMWLKANRAEFPWMNEARKVFLYGWCILLFLLCTAEVNDFFRRLLLHADTESRANLIFRRNMAFPVLWMTYSLPLVWCGARRKLPPALDCGLIVAAFAAGFAALRGLAFVPIESFHPVLNDRAFALVFILAGWLIHALWLKENDSWPAWATSVMGYGWCALLLLLCTVEANDYFRMRLLGAAGEDKVALAFRRDMTFVLVWTACALPFIRCGLKKQLLPALRCGLVTLAVAALLGALRGLEFEPTQRFTLLLNYRAAVMTGVIAGLLALAWWMCDNKAAGFIQIIIALLALELITVETRDFFASAVLRLFSLAGAGDLAVELKRLGNLKQMSLSVGWLLYSILLIGFGIWKRLPGLRILAIAVFGVSILKIFIYDLSFLETLYRIFSFIGLGVILLAVSYLYHRFKAVIFDAGTREESFATE